MRDYRVAVIGTGPDPDNQIPGESFAMGYRHAGGYTQLENCSLIACADLVPENAQNFAQQFSIPSKDIYEDYHEMLDESEPDIISVCTPPTVHSEIVVDCAHSASVEAIHCEKPMADTWGDSRLMTQECDRRGIQLTFNHQLRLSDRVQQAKQLLDEDTIGTLQRIELARQNLFDAGTHQIDLCNYFNDDRSASWVLSQIDYQTENLQFGVHNENQAVAHWMYDNDVHTFAATGMGFIYDVIGCQNRLIGSDGVIEVGVADGPPLRYKSDDTTGWQTIDCGGYDPLEQTIEHVVDALDNGTEPTVSARHALNTTEIIFACWESVRQRSRIDLPLTIADNPLEAMVQTGDLHPKPPEDTDTDQVE